MWGTCVGALGRRSAGSSGPLVPGREGAAARQGRGSCRDSSLVEVRCSSLESAVPRRGGGERGGGQDTMWLHSPLGRGANSHCSGDPLRKANNLCPGRSRLPYPLCAAAVGAPPATALLEFLSGQWLGFKIPSFKGPGNVHACPRPPAERLRVSPAPSQAQKAAAQWPRRG